MNTGKTRAAERTGPQYMLSTALAQAAVAGHTWVHLLAAI